MLDEHLAGAGPVTGHHERLRNGAGSAVDLPWNETTDTPGCLAVAPRPPLATVLDLRRWLVRVWCQVAGVISYAFEWRISL